MLLRNPRLTLLFGSLLLIMIGFGIVIPTLPFFARELGASSVDMGLLVTVWAAAQFVIAPKWGAFSDRMGRRPAIILGLIGFGAGYIFMGMATQLWMLYAARITGGLLSASTFPSAKAYIADVTPAEDRGPSMGLLGAAFGLGFMLGPAIGGAMAPLGVRLTFFAAGGCGLITAALVYFLLPEPENRSSSGLGNKSVVQAVVDAVKKPYAVLYWLPFAMTFAGAAMFSMLGFFLMDKFSATEAQVGMTFTVSGAVGIATQGFLISHMLDMWGEVKTLRTGLLISGVGYVLLTLAPSFPLTLPAVALISLGLGFSRPTVTSLLSRVTDMSQGLTMGMQSSFDALGRMLGPVWAGFLYSLAIHAPFISSAAVFVLGIIYMTMTIYAIKRPLSTASSEQPVQRPPASND